MDRHRENAHDSTVREIAGEKAASLGRAGRRLEASLASLASFDAGRVPPSGVTRAELLDEAGEALFFYIVQREAMGLRDTREVLRELGVPAEVERRMGLKRRPGR